MTQQALTRPIEITDDLKNFSITHTGGTDAFVLTTGVSPSIIALLNHINDLLVAADATLSCYLSSDYKIVFARSAGTISAIDFTDIDLGKLLGFRANVASAAASHTATDTPKFTWLPAYCSFDTDRFWEDYQFSGSVSTSGIVSGISLSTGIHKRTIQWDAQPEALIALDGATQSFTWSTIEYPEIERCLEKFTKEARTSAPTSSDAEGISTKGFYFIFDLDVYTGSSPTVALPSTMDGGGYKRKLASSPDRYIWCNLHQAWKDRKTTINNMDKYYTIGLELAACLNAVPSWNVS